MTRADAIDRAVRRFLDTHYPNERATWLRNRDAWGMLSTLDLKAIRALYAQPYHNQFMGW